MKKYLSALLSATALLMATACTSDEESTTSIVTVSQTTKTLQPTAGQKATFTFKSDRDWTASSTAAWLSVSPQSGRAGESTVTATTTSINRTKSDRHGQVTIAAGTMTKNFSVSQSGKYAMFDAKEYHIGADGGEVTMTFTSNVGENDHLALAYQQLDWVSFDGQSRRTRAEWQGQVTKIHVEPNTDKAERAAMYAMALMDGDDDWVELDTALIIQSGLSTGYVSTDYSRDGEVTVLQEHTVGHGIPVVLMGDGFTDRDIADSTYLNIMKKAVENLFSEEPVRSMRDYFDVYVVNAVSANDAVGSNYSTAFSCVPDFGSTNIDCDDGKITAYAEKVDRKDSLNMLTVVIVNSNAKNGVTYLFNHDGRPAQYAIALCPICESLESELFRQVLTHEAIGHGLAKLADEYGYDNNGEADDDTKLALKAAHAFGWMKNADTTDEPAKTVWWQFVGDERFADEAIGTYEGGYTYTIGIWRPTANSMMNQNDCPFNAPSRKLIYDRIRYLGENAAASTLDEFARFDAAHKPERWEYTRTRGSGTPERIPAPPVVIERRSKR